MPAVDPQLFQLFVQTGLGYNGALQLAAVLPRATGPAPSAAAGAAAGTSPPAPVIVTGSTDGIGVIQVGTGSAPPAGGVFATVTFASPYAVAPRISLDSITQGAAGLDPGIGTVTTTSFQIVIAGTAAASQAVTVYQFNYTVRPG